MMRSPPRREYSKCPLHAAASAAAASSSSSTLSACSLPEDDDDDRDLSWYLTPEAVRIPTLDDFLQSQAAGDDASREEETIDRILTAFEQYLQQHSATHLGYPYNLRHFTDTSGGKLERFLQYTINNLGDPYQPSNYAIHSRLFETAVVDWFANLWQFPVNYWGYVTASGTEGNLHGLLLARECFPTATLYTSTESHYSIFKAAKLYRMPCTAIPTLPNGQVHYDLLQQQLHRDYTRNQEPVILNVNIGTTVKGALDNIDKIVSILQNVNIPREHFYIHCDGALSGLVAPLMPDARRLISFRDQPIDSMAVSGHKMLGCPMPCGVTLCRDVHVRRVAQHIGYLNSSDTTIMGSRNGHAALHMWYLLRAKGVAGLQREVEYCRQTARLLRDQLWRAGIACQMNQHSNTVVFERPASKFLIQKYQLACENDVAHVVV
jgi:histidine decarboxylase